MRKDCFVGLLVLLAMTITLPVFAQDVQEPAVAGTFYPGDSGNLKNMVDVFIDKAKP